MKISLGITFEAIGKAIGRDEVWVASAFYGQVCIRIPSSYLSRFAGVLILDFGRQSWNPKNCRNLQQR